MQSQRLRIYRYGSDTSSNISLGDMSDCRMIRKEEVLLGLPITFESTNGPATVMANPDTGAHANAISLQMVQKLGLQLHKTDGKAFSLITGKSARCCGIVKVWCRFGKTYNVEPDAIHCTLYVFQKLSSPLIMCRRFLWETGTFTVYRNRLVQLAVSTLALPAIRAFGDTKERLLCSIDGEDVEALPDSGSDIDIISYQYAQSRGFVITPREEWVMLADMTVLKTLGVCTLQLALGHGAHKIIPHNETEGACKARAGSEPNKLYAKEPVVVPPTSPSGSPSEVSPARTSYRDVIQSAFYVLENINTDIIIGTGSLESLQVYSHHARYLVMQPTQDDATEDCPLNRIVLLSTLEQKLRNIARSWAARMGKSDLVTSK